MANDLIADVSNNKSLSWKFRVKRDKLLREFILRKRQKVEGAFRIIDIGGTLDYWSRVGFDWMEANDIDVTCVNFVASEFGEASGMSHRIRCIVGDGRALVDHADNSFDLVHSNSVVEHVGNWPDMRNFSNEVRRLAPSYYVQTPYFWFPMDPHFARVPMFHWMPVSWRLKLVRRMKVGWSAAVPDIDHAMRNIMGTVLLDEAQFKSLFPNARVEFERVFLLPKSMIAFGG